MILSLGIDTAKYASELLHKHLIDAFNQFLSKSKNRSIHSLDFDRNQFIHIIKHTFLQLDKQLVGLVNDQSGSVCVRSYLMRINLNLISI